MTTIDKAGIYLDVSNADYHKDPVCEPSLSSSVAKVLIDRSPAHARLAHVKFGAVADDPTPGMIFGSVVHEMLIGKGEGFAVLDVDDYRTKDAKALRDDSIARGLTPIKKADHLRAKTLVDSCKAKIDSMGFGFALAEGHPEAVAVWNTCGIWCRAMMDRWIPDRALIVDFKIVDSAKPESIARQIASMRYDMRSEFYKFGINLLRPDLAGRLEFLFLFIEAEAPHSVTPVMLNGEWKTLGVSMVSRAIDSWKACLEANIWPDYTKSMIRMEPPAWLLASEISANAITP